MRLRSAALAKFDKCVSHINIAILHCPLPLTCLDSLILSHFPLPFLDMLLGGVVDQHKLTGVSIKANIPTVNIHKSNIETDRKDSTKDTF